MKPAAPLAVANLFGGVGGDLAAEEFVEILRGRGFRVERIVSTGHATPAGQWYDAPEAEWVMVLRGAARLEVADSGEVALAPGDHVLIPAGTRHRVAWTAPGEPTVWLAVHFGVDA